MSKKDNIKIINDIIDITNIQLLPIKLQRRIKKYGNSAICPICKKLISLDLLFRGNIYCSRTCRYQSQQIKLIAKNNIAKVKNRYFSTIQGRQHGQRRIKQIYKVDNVFKNKNIQEKIKQTNIQKYGVQCIFSSQQFKQQIKQTNLIKFKFQYPSQNLKIKQKLLNTRKSNNLQKYGVQYKALLTIFSLQHVQPLFTQQQYEGLNKEYLWKCKLCGKQFKSIYNAGKLNTKCQCQYFKHTSLLEKQVADFCSQYYQIKRNWSGIIWPYELDIVIPQIKLAIQFNGLYWHQISFKPKNYHFQKSIKCRQKGYRLIHIWENDWINDKENIKQSLLNAFNNTQKYVNDDIINFSWNNVLPGQLVKQPFIQIRNQYQIENCGLFKVKF